MENAENFESIINGGQSEMGQMYGEAVAMRATAYRELCKNLSLIHILGMAQQVCGNKPWSVRMAESEMVRCPESWQLDFQTRLKLSLIHIFFHCFLVFNDGTTVQHH